MSAADEKRAHALAVIAALDAVKDVIASQPDLWLGGLNPPLIGCAGMMDYQAGELRKAFGLDQRDQ
jgi:hypothetical protein